MKHRNPLYVLSLMLFLGIFLAVTVSPAWAFAEEELGFRDQDGTYYPPSGNFPENRISTIHDDLSLALANAAGFTSADGQTLRIWDQLVDSESLPGAVTPYLYGNAGFYTAPDPGTDCSGKNHARPIWPTSGFDATTSSTTSRFGPYSPFFHFPHLDGSDLLALHDWAWGTTDSLQGYEAYAWGGLTDLTLMQATQNNGCIITRPARINMPVPAGSLKAFATYLHSLADAYSHLDCLTALAAETPPAPWGTHTVKVLGDNSVPACDYNPNNPQNDDAHGREFGSLYPSDNQRTISAARAIYSELSKRSKTREGLYVPLSLSTTLTINGVETTLDNAIVAFVTTWNYDQPAQRRDYVDSLTQALNSTTRTLLKPRVTTITRLDPNPSTASSVRFTVSFSEAVTGVDKADFKLTVSGISSASIYSVSGSGAARTVTVKTGTGYGTIRLDLTDNDTIKNASNVPLGGSGTGNANYTTGQKYTLDRNNTFTSAAAQDGWILESSEISNTGGKLLADSTLRVGDDASRKQYRSLLSFDTTSLPDKATIVNVTLKFKTSSVTGADPFGTLGALLADIRKSYFGSSSNLEIGDFQATPSKSAASSFAPVSGAAGWYQLTLSSSDYTYINKSGLTQFRLRFTTDDDNDSTADYLSIYAGEASASVRPVLLVEYTLP